MNGYVYFIAADNGTIKIGWSTDPNARLANLQSASGGKLKLLGAVKGTREHEYYAHKVLAKYCIRGEWFSENDEVSKFIMEALVGRWGAFVEAPPIPLSDYQKVAESCASIINRCAKLCGIDSDTERPDVDRTNYFWGVRHSVIWKFLYRPADPMTKEYSELLEGVVTAVEASRKELDKAEAFAREILNELEQGLTSARAKGAEVARLESLLAEIKTVVGEE